MPCARPSSPGLAEMFVLGLTGSIGMGKSTVGGGFRCFAVPVFDSDAAVHALFERGGAAVAAVAAAFPGCLDPGGGVDRAALGRIVFDDPPALARLEAIVHPLVRAAQRRFLARRCATGGRLAVLDIPLLYETGGERLVDAVAVVSARPEVQAQRVLKRPGMSADRLATILRRQLPDADKRRRADFVIRTDLDRRRALRPIGRILDRVRGRRGTRWPHAWPP